MLMVSSARLESSFRTFSGVASITAIIVGGLVLFGWVFDIAALKSVFSGLVSMKANTAVAFILAGVSLWLLRPEPPARQKRLIARICASAVALLGLLTLAEYIFGWQLGIDQVLFSEAIGAVGTSHPGRMAPSTALNLLLIGGALLLLDAETQRGHRPAQVFALAAATISLLCLIGYAYGIKFLYGLASYTQIALHTALTFIVLSLGLLCARPYRGLMAVVTSESSGGVLARRLLPAAIGIPIVLGWLRLQGQRAGFYDTDFGRALLVLSTIVVFAVLIYSSAASLHRADTELKRTEKEIRQLNEDLQKRATDLAAANKELEAFTYSVSHDLRSPLRQIDGFSQLLLEEHGGQLSQEARHYLVRVRDGTRQMGRLVDDLLNLARVGRREVNRQVTGMNSLVREVLEELTSEMSGRQIELKIGALPFVECDPALMKQVFYNLLSNAIKFTRPRERAVIEVNQMAIDGRPGVQVRDNGVGFSMKYADKLFGVFQRLHRPEDFEGTGVGLATVQRIIHKHGGQVWAEAELDKGATFYFTLGLPETREKEASRTIPVGGER